MPGHDVVVIGFSAGGIKAMSRLAAGLTRDFPAPVFVAHHFPANSVTALPNTVGNVPGNSGDQAAWAAGFSSAEVG